VVADHATFSSRNNGGTFTENGAFLGVSDDIGGGRGQAALEFRGDDVRLRSKRVHAGFCLTSESD
jgi:hypothetical protein